MNNSGGSSRPATSIDLGDFPASSQLLKEQGFLQDYPPRKTSRLLTRPLILHLLLFSVYTFVYFGLIKNKLVASSTANQTIAYSPAQEAGAIQYRTQVINSTVYTKSPYSGNPSPEVDHAWSELMRGFNIRVSQDVLNKINRHSIPLADGSGDFIAGMDISHHLHCLYSLRHALAPEYYAEELASMYKAEGETYPTHIAHCIEILSMVLLCKASGSIYTYAWSETPAAPLTNFAVDHTCVDWEFLQGWTDKSSFNIHDDILIHPIFGKWPGSGPV